MQAALGAVQGVNPVRRHQVLTNGDPIVVTLVHGTYARGAAWTKEGSALRSQIAETLVGHGRNAHFDVFEWSERNTHKARIKAGYELAAHIRQLRKSHPRCSHFIVAHSHGGNLALFAHKHLPEHLHALGIATLGTPFLHAKLKGDLQNMTLQSLQREAMGDGDIASSVIAFTFAALAFLLVQNELKLGSVGLWAWLMATAATFLSFGITYPLVKFVLFPRLTLILHHYSSKRTALRLANAIRFPKIPRTHVLSFAYPRDEAGLLLDTLELTTKVPTWLMRGILTVGLVLFVPLFVIAYYAKFADEVTGVLGEFLEPAIASYVTQAAGFTYDLAYWVAIVFGMLWVSVAGVRSLLSLLRGHPKGFGWESPFLHNWAEIGARTTPEIPEARSNFTEVVPFTARTETKGWRHNHFYEDRRILKALCYWMEKISASRSTAEKQQRKAG